MIENSKCCNAPILDRSSGVPKVIPAFICSKCGLAQPPKDEVFYSDCCNAATRIRQDFDDKYYPECLKCEKACKVRNQSPDPKLSIVEDKRKHVDEFIRLGAIIRDHLNAEGVSLSEYEIGHLAILLQREIEAHGKAIQAKADDHETETIVLHEQQHQIELKAEYERGLYDGRAEEGIGCFEHSAEAHAAGLTEGVEKCIEAVKEIRKADMFGVPGDISEDLAEFREAMITTLEALKAQTIKP